MGTLTTTLVEHFYAIVNTTGYGISTLEAQKLQEILTNPESGHTLETKQGTVIVCRTKTFHKEKSTYMYGFRLTSAEHSSTLAEKIVEANRKLQHLDNPNPEAVWAEKPFWAN